MNHYILEFVNKCTGAEGVIRDGMSRDEAVAAYKEYYRRWWACEVWYGPADNLTDKPAMAGI